MITFIGRDSVGAAKRVDMFGLSGDDKPLTVGNGSIFKEIDTGDVYMFDEENTTWYKQ